MKKSKPNISSRFFYNLLFVAIVSISLIGFMWLRDEHSGFHTESELMREQYLTSHKNMIKTEVDKAVAYIDFKEAQVEKQLKDSIKNRVYEAHEIAKNLYNQYKDKRSLPEIKKMVEDALRPIRFNNGRGYYFAFNLDGIEELFADRPEMEGKNMLPVRGAKGEYVVWDMLQIAKKDSEGFYKYTWTKPKRKGYFPKIAFIKLFKPFNWVIGTGEYLDDVESDIQKEVLEFIEQITFGKNGYVFAGRWDGFTLSGPAKGKNNWDITDVNGVKVVQELIGLAKKGNGFLKYVMPKLEDKRPAPKLSYVVGIPKWEWYVGTGIYIDEIETAIANKEKLLEKKIIAHAISIVLILIVFILFVSFVAIQIARKMKTNFDLFSRFFERAAIESATIKPDMMDFSELENLAHSANDMITARKKAEDGLRASEEKYRDLVENINEVIYATDNTGAITYISPVIESQAEYKVSDLMGRTFNEFIHPEDLIRFEKQFQDVLSGISEPGEYRILTKSGDVRWIRHSSRPISEENQIIGVRGAFTDITESKRLQAQLQQAEKMESMGLMAGGIAHDLNNILSGIVSYPDLLLADLPKNSKLRKPLKIIKESGYRAADVVSDLLTIARGVETSKQVFNLNILIKEYFNSAEQKKLKKRIHPLRLTRNLIMNCLISIVL
jgi:PAS domain S-box-containing protein